jgi:tight adherence protein B
MLMILITVFVAAFVIIFLLFMGLSPASSRDMESTMARLDAIAIASPVTREPETIDILKEEKLSDVPWLNDLLQSFNVFPAMRKTLRQANVEWTLGSVMLASVFIWVLVGFLTYLRTRASLMALLVGGVLASIPWILVIYKRNKRFMAFEEKLPEALDLMVGAIRAGHGFTSSIGLASREISDPIGGEFKQCFDEQNFGLDLRLAMRNLEDRVPIPDVQLIVSAVLIQKESGGNLAEILEKVAYVIRERFRLKRQIRVHTAQGRLTGWILAIFPVVLGFVFYIMDPPRMSLLWTRPIGIKLLWTAAFMETIGVLIIRKIIRPRV